MASAKVLLLVHAFAGCSSSRLFRLASLLWYGLLMWVCFLVLGLSFDVTIQRLLLEWFWLVVIIRVEADGGFLCCLSSCLVGIH